MSHANHRAGQHITAKGWPFYALIMAAMLGSASI
jgi:hypothetical protein